MLTMEVLVEGDQNCGPLVPVATALPTEPQAQSKTFFEQTKRASLSQKFFVEKKVFSAKEAFIANLKSLQPIVKLKRN